MRIYPSPVGVMDEKPRIARRKGRHVGNVFAFAKFQSHANFLSPRTSPLVMSRADGFVFVLKAAGREL